MKYWLFVCLWFGNAGVVYGNMCCGGYYLSKVIPVGSQCPSPVPFYNSSTTYTACSTSCCTSQCVSIPSTATVPFTTVPGFLTQCTPTYNLTNYYTYLSTAMATFNASNLNLTCMLECVPFTNLHPAPIASTTSLIPVIPTTTPARPTTNPATPTAMCCAGFFASDTIPANSTCPPNSSIAPSQLDYSNCAQSCCLTHCLYSDQNQSNTSFVASSCVDNSSYFMQELANANSFWKQNNLTMACSIECDKFKYENLNSGEGNDKTGLEINSAAAPNSNKNFITILMTLVTLFCFVY